MVQRRAVNRADKELQPEKLPTLYKTLVPLTPERHDMYYLSRERSYEYAQTTNAIPITADEFPQAMRSYPIVLAGHDTPTPVALVGYSAGHNDHVAKDGSWKEGAYIPAYLRRYPFAYVRESHDVDRNILCADLSSMIFSTSGEEDRALFKDGKPSEVLTNVMDFSNRYETALQRTRTVMDEAKKLDLIDPSSVTITRDGKTTKVEGFNIISEEKLRKLPDDVLAGLARRGVLNLFTAHHLSLTNFTTFGGS